jgi:hypothetical protein
MQNKNNRWLDVQIVIVSLSLTFSLALWNQFAGDSQPLNSQGVSNPTDPALLVPASQPAPIIYLGGPAPKPTSSLPEPTQSLSPGASGSDSSPSNASLSASSPSSAPAPAPAPVTSTGSSKP